MLGTQRAGILISDIKGLQWWETQKFHGSDFEFSLTHLGSDFEFSLTPLPPFVTLDRKHVTLLLLDKSQGLQLQQWL
jgi:hypothetical protein